MMVRAVLQHCSGFNWRYEKEADRVCCPQTSPPCSDPPQCQSQLRSSSSCQTPAGGAGLAHRTAHSRTAPANTGRTDVKFHIDKCFNLLVLFVLI